MITSNREHIDVQPAIQWLVDRLLRRQQPDGTWVFTFDNGTIIDAYVIIVLRLLNYEQEDIIQQLHSRVTKDQHPDGYWQLYADEHNGNLTATIDNYYALLLSGYSKYDDDHMVKARTYIENQGGIARSKGLLSKAILASTGQIPWPKAIQSIPIEIMLIPNSAPVNLFEFSGYSRVHLIPMIIMATLDFNLSSDVSLKELLSTNSRVDQIQFANIIDLSDTRVDLDAEIVRAYEQMREHLQSSSQRLLGSTIRQIALEKAESYMLERIEQDGTLYSYASCTILMIFALLALGYDSRSELIVNAVQGLLDMRGRSASNRVTIQNSPSTIWDTALISYALQEANVPFNHSSLLRANKYLLNQQHTKKGDWSLHNPDAAPGGWGFSESNSINPDVDDTTAALRAIHRLAQHNAQFHNATKVGLDWLLSMQNKDGGWPAFEKGVSNPMLTWIALDGAKAAAIDPSTADLTGRTLQYLGRYSELTQHNSQIKRGVKWLMNNQEADGSWYGKWGICYIYGTWAALTGLMAVGVGANEEGVQHAVRWLNSIQNSDGGWGESCQSDRDMTYIPLHYSTPSQTAWALDALIAVHDTPTPQINKGIKLLMSLINNEGWQSYYPTGAGLPGNFYVHYDSYRYIFPLLALSHYYNKYSR